MTPADPIGLEEAMKAACEERDKYEIYSWPTSNRGSEVHYAKGDTRILLFGPAPDDDCWRFVERLAMRAAIAAHLRSLAAAGMVIVPREPTEAMRRAGNDVGSDWAKTAQNLENVATIYRAMLDAAQAGEEKTK